MASMHSLTAAATTLLLLGAAVGCGGAQSQPETVESYIASANAAPSADPAEGPAAPSKKKQAEAGDLNEDQEKQMEIALRRGGDKASNCSTVVQNAPAGSGEVHVLFDGEKGRVTDVTVGPPWAGTPVEACIKRAFVGEIILRFDGDPREVPYTVKIGGKPDDPADKAKDKDAKDAKGKDAKGKPVDKKDKKK